MLKPTCADKRNRCGGVTLTEMLIVVAIIGTVFMFARVGVFFINGLLQNTAAATVQREAQTVLYSITKDIRNCREIVSFSSSTLTLRVFNTKKGFNIFTNPGLYDLVNIGSMTYSYVSAGNESYIRKTTVFNEVMVEDQKLLRNMLLTPDTTSYIFNACDAAYNPPCPKPWEAGAAPIPYESIEIWLRMSPSFVKNSNVNYVARAMKRTRNSL